MRRCDQRLHCWIRQQRYILAVHKFIYYILVEPILEDLQFDYLEKRLEVVENRHPGVSDAVTKDGYLSPNMYADALIHPSIESRAIRTVALFNDGQLDNLRKIPLMSGEFSENDLYEDALWYIVRYPI